MTQTSQSKKQRTVRLVAEPTTEKVWAAVALLSQVMANSAGMPQESKCWVNINDVGDFLKKQQIAAHAVAFDDKDPVTRYALKKTALHPRGWEDVVIAGALSTCVAQGFLEHLRHENENYFTFKPEREHDLWRLRNTAIPKVPLG